MKIFATLSLLAFSLVSFAQDGTSYIELKNSGNEALKAKDYAKALELYEDSYNQWPEDVEVDKAMIFNMATTARRVNNNEKAYKYYSESKELEYKGGPMRGKHWDKRMWADNGEKIVNSIQKYVDRGGK